MQLTKSQQLIYDMEMFAGGTISVICGSMMTRGEKTVEQLQQALNAVYQANDALRIRVTEENGQVNQYVVPFEQQEFEVLSFDSKENLDAYGNDYAKIPLNVAAELCETKIVLLPGQYGVLVKLHHLIGDAWTLALLGNQFNAVLRNEEITAYSYLEHIADEEKYFQSKRYARDREFFLEQFRKCPEVTYLSEKTGTFFGSRRRTFVIGQEEAARISAYAAENNSSAFMLFAGALAAYMNRTKMNAREFHIGIAVLNRSTVKEKNTAGMFVNTAPMLIELDNDASFAENLAAIEASAFGVFRHQKFNYGDVLASIRREYGFSEKLYDVMLSYQNASVTNSDTETSWYCCGMQTESLQFHIDDRDGEGIYRIHYDYLTDRFTEAEIDQLHQHITALLFSAISDDSRKLHELEIMSGSERQMILEQFNGAAVDYPVSECVHTLFERHAAQTPGKTALIAQDGRLSFGQLNTLANRAANRLMELGVKKGDIVAVALPRKTALYAALLGILKTGAAYMPIDPNYPQDRIRYMLNESRARLCITEENVEDLLSCENCSNPEVTLNGEDIYCALHTSGSTGMPKMALLKHGGLRSFLAANQRFWDGVDTVVSATIVTFDAFILDSVLSMAQGCQVVLASEDEIYNQSGFEKLFEHSDRNMFFATPTKLENYITGSETKDFLKRIKRFVVGGEVFSEQLLKLIKTHTPDSRVFNIYGPTEATICATVDELEPGREITIGTPVANDQIYIVDSFLNPVPVGVVGELCIAGSGVGAGYINRPELTDEKFIDNPFGAGKLYRTGDLACWRADGKIRYVGRNDFQVKIRGLRIELGEIETAIADQQGIDQAVVVVRKNDEGRQIICAFYTGRETEARELRQYIGRRLPKYMVPHIFTHLETMPMTPSGKISRTALPQIDLYNIDLSVEYVAPETEAEKALCSAAAAVLGIEQVGVLDNFFDLGGDSLKGIELISRLENAGFRLDTRTIFDCDTMQDLAGRMEVLENSDEEFEYSGDICASEAQMRVYTAQILNPDSTTYNVPYVFRAKELDPQQLQKAVYGMLERHEILRTRFENKDGRIIQTADDAACCTVEHLEKEDLEGFIRPFDLGKAPLLRIGYCGNTVMIDMHHIITDGGSMPVFLKELNELYMGRKLMGKVVPYKQFAVQPQDDSASEAYWLDEFRDEVPVLELNTDHKPEQNRTFRGDAYYDRIDPALNSRIQQMCKKLGVTPYVFYMSGFQILLSKYSGSEDVVVGMPISGRSSRFLNTIGMFVNTVALRSQPAGNKTVKTYLQEVKEKSLQAITHQDYPYGKLVKKLQNLDGRSGIFDVMFAFQSEEMTDVIFGDERCELLPIPVTASKYDFTFNVMPRAQDLVVMVEYCTELYERSTIGRLVDSYQAVLEQMLEEDKELNDISSVTASEKEKILNSFNNTALDYDREKCLHEIFQDQVRKDPGKLALVAVDGRFTYGQLNARANRIAHGLIARGIRTGDIVAFALKRESHLIAAMLGILKAGAAYLPVDPDYPQDRVDYMISDSGAKLFVTEENIESLLAFDDESDPCVQADARYLCYCIYTSGSTGKPKAVAISHRNAHNFILSDGGEFHRAVTKQCECVFATNAVVFDITVQDILLPLLNGLYVVFARTDTLSQVCELLDETAMGRTALIITPTKLQMYMQSENFCRNLNRFGVIMVGAENFPHQLYHQLRNYTDAAIFNGYGPTETTCGVLYARVEEGKRITIGKPVANTQIYIVDDRMSPVSVGVSGELCIAGDSVGMGYLHREELTAERFVDNPFGEGKLYKTGDLAYWLDDGCIVYLGRNDFQVKIRGLRIELGEIENAICTVDGISQAVVDVRKNDSGRQIICAFYTGRRAEAKEIREQISKMLPKYMLPHIFTHLDEMPMTAGGKINRKGLPQVDLYNVDLTVEYVEPEQENEKILTRIVSEILGVKRVGLLDNFFDLGGDSLKALELISRLEAEGLCTDSKTIFDSQNMKELSAGIQRHHDDEEPEEAIGDIPATAAQMRVYTAQQMSGSSTTYNVTFVFRAAELDPERLQRAVDGLLQRHEILRTRFENRGGVIYQVAEDARCLVEALETEDISGFIRPFDLSRAPLIRVGWSGTTVMVDIHHIVTDGSSMPVFIRELNELYMGRTLPAAAASYKRFALEEKDLSASEAYWMNVYREEPAELELNTDFKRKAQSFNGGGVYDAVPLEMHGQIQAKCKALNMTPYVFYMSAFNILLSKFSGQEDIVVGMPMSGRSHRYLNTIGMFVNTVALRNRPEGNKTVGQFLAEVRENSVNAIEHQDYPYGELVKKLKIESGGRNPLFDVMLAYQSEEMTEVYFADQKAELLPLPITTSKYDLTLSVLPREDAVVLVAEYCTDLYREETIRRLLCGYKQILGQLLDGTKLLKDLSVMTVEDEEQVLRGFNATQRDYLRDACLHQLFEEQVRLNPEKLALIAPDRNLSYLELNREANRTAHALMEMGVAPGDVVAFALPRKSNMIAVILGILKAGAAYLPVDPDYPQDRIEFMLEDSGAKFMVTQSGVNDLFVNDQTDNPDLQLPAEGLCYCIYTSGSTGKPKGTLLKHRGIVNLVQDMSIYGDMSGCQRIGVMTTITFDVASQEIFTALSNGYTAVLMPERRETRIDTIIDGILEHQIDVIYATPTYLDSLASTAARAEALGRCVKKCVLAGEGFYINEYLAAQEGIAFVNHYGPAETHVATAAVMENLSDIHIGKPIANTQIYMLDRYLRPVPVGVTGELCIAGDCVGAGYLNRPDLNAEKFIDNPFGPGKLYRTGDLAYWRPDGNIAYIGRNDFQVKIRGQRIELGEIESAMVSMDAISQAVVVVRKNGEGRQIICAFYTGDELDAREIRGHIGKKLPKYMVPHIFTHLDEMPLTVSGKISRTALPEVDLYNTDMSVEYVAPETEQEQLLAAATAQVLGAERVGMLDNFFDLGGDSLKAIELISKLEEGGFSTDTKTIFQCETMKELAQNLQLRAIADEQVEFVGDIPATAAQMRIYTSQTMNPELTSYNVPYIFRVAQLDPQRLQAAVDKMVQRHEILRTWFRNDDGHIIQLADDSARCLVEALDSDDPGEFVRPFDLAKAPLIRVGYHENVVMIDMHHIITDGGSMPVFLNELNELYMGRELTEQTVPYKLFAVQPQDYSESKDYWLEVFREEPPVLELNTDFKPGQTQSFAGDVLYDVVPTELYHNIIEKSRELNVTPFVYYMGAFNILLSKFSGQEDIVVGMPMSGRSTRFLNTIGMFVNTIALRNRPVGSKKIREFLDEVKENAVNAIAHQEYPYGELVKKLHLGATGRNPLFDVMFAYQSEETTHVVFGDKEAELLPMPVTTSKYDFTFNIMPREDHAVVMVEFSTELFEDVTIRRLAAGYKAVLTQLLREDQLIRDISPVTETDLQLLEVFNEGSVDYPWDECLHHLLERHAKTMPEKTALIACDRELTYDQMNRQANRIAHSLLEMGVEKGDIVAVALPRRSYLFSAMFGVLKAGAAYMPIDPNYPEDRIQYMLTESRAKLCLTEENIHSLLDCQLDHDPCILVTGDDLYCALHTSGSTGMPKMALLRQRGLRSFLAANQRFWDHIDTVVSATIVTFDAFILDSVLSVAQGCRVILASEEDIFNQSRFEELFDYSDRNMFFSTPTKIENYIINSETRRFLSRIGSFVIGGEVFSDHLLELLRYHSSDCRVFNIYGPTEATICVMVDELEQGREITIGEPLWNVQIHIVDSHMQRVPIGVTGELCIAGVGVGAGYINRPDMTAEKFIDNPFGEGKLYKTGDLAYWRDDGKVTYVGRNDFQVKIRGLRIELGEIENVLCDVRDITQAVVVVRKNSSGRQIICAFYTGDQLDTKGIRQYIGKRLPKYMVPHIFTYLDEMPLTSSGKIDRKALPQIDLENITSDQEYVAPRTNIQMELCKILEKVLEIKPVGMADNFFDLGGDSLKAIEFVSKAHNEGIYFNLQNVFDYPTVEELSAFIEKGDAQMISFADIDFGDINQMLSSNCAEEIEVPEACDVGNILLTGSTGYLGIHILAEYLKHDSGIAYCLVRGKNQEDSEQRLHALLASYFHTETLDTDRIRVLCADLSKDHFGLEEEVYQMLMDQVDTAIHTAASVKHYGSYQYFYEANVESTKRMIAFCQDSGAKLIHTSTLSVSGTEFLERPAEMEGLAGVDFTERDLYIGQQLDNVYVRSKFEAELEVMTAMTRGLKANIMRIGNLTNRYSDGLFQRNHTSNAFLQRLKAILTLGVFPETLLDFYSEFTPVDQAAAAFMCAVRHFNQNQTVFHISNIKLVQMRRMGEYFSQMGYSLEATGDTQFTAALRKTTQQPDKAYILEAFINDLNENDQLTFSASIYGESKYTARYLQAIGFEWGDIDLEYLRKYVKYFEDIGYLEK